MNTSLIYTIGYGTRAINDFIDLLRQFEIDYLIDVRSKPHSSFKPEFSRTNLEGSLQNRSIQYVFMGDLLGGQPQNPSVLTPEGKINYSKVREKEFYIKGIERLKKALSQGFRIVLMCSEEKPERCHRSKLIGETLSKEDIEVLHIDELGQVVTQLEVMLRLTKGQMMMFDELDPGYTSRKSYRSEVNDDD